MTGLSMAIQHPSNFESLHMTDSTTEQAPEHHAVAQTLPVYLAADFRAIDGANLGDGLSFAEELMLDDTYSLKETATQTLLAMSLSDDRSIVITDGTDVGTAGNPLHLDCAITLMEPDGTTFDAVVLVEVAPTTGDIQNIYLLALAPISSLQPYRLVGVDPEGARARIAEVACVSFTRGTRITMASGQQCLIEDLKVGDKVLSRDDGPQTVRWIGQTTTRAVGDFAPIRIKKGTLNNENDLIVSPNHRLFIYQRVDEIGAGRSEILVKAKHLVNGDSVTVQDGGFVDYFQLLFDDHQIIFAEGIAAESLMLDERTSPALPTEVAQEILDGVPMHHKRGHEDFEIGTDQTSGGDIAERLRRASST